MTERTVFQSMTHKHVVRVGPDASVHEAACADDQGQLRQRPGDGAAGPAAGHPHRARPHDPRGGPRAGSEKARTKVREVMTPKPICIAPELPVSDAVVIMLEKRLPPPAGGHRGRVPDADRRSWVSSRCAIALPREIGTALSQAEFNEQMNDAAWADGAAAAAAHHSSQPAFRARARQRRFDHGALALQLRRPRALVSAGRSASFPAPSAPASCAFSPRPLVARCRWNRSVASAFARLRLDHASQPVLSPLAFSSEMQSTGHTGTHNSQPVQCGSMTVCMRLLPPRMASVGQASRHSVQPMHQFSSMTASGARAFDAVGRIQGQGRPPVSAARRATPSAPPGGHWLMSASPAAMAWA
jgi:CBS domain-containing protein